MKVYTFRISYALKHHLGDVFDHHYREDAKYIHIVSNNQKEARKKALNRFNLILRKNDGYTAKDLSYRKVDLFDTYKIHKDGFLDVYISD